MAPEPQRLSAGEIYDQVLANGRSELNRPAAALAFSGLAAGLLMGLTGLGVAGVRAVLPGREADFVALLFYPLGFVAVIIGRAQLFTENTLFPVVLILENRRHLPPTLRLWGIVFTTNVLGALAFAALIARTGALRPAAVASLIRLATTATGPSLADVFTSAIIAGWLVALMAWLVSGALHTIGQITLIWLSTVLVGLLHLAHCIASSGYILVAVLTGAVPAGTYVAWLGTATAGNIVGGVVIVSLLNYGQVRAGAQAVHRRQARVAGNQARFRRYSQTRNRTPSHGDDTQK